MNEKEYIAGYFRGLEESVAQTDPYRQGIKQGKHEERQYILHFVEEHEGIPITVEDIVNEIEGRYRVEMNEYLKRQK